MKFKTGNIVFDTVYNRVGKVIKIDNSYIICDTDEMPFVESRTRLAVNDEVMKYYTEQGWVKGAYVYGFCTKEIKEITKTFINSNSEFYINIKDVRSNEHNQYSTHRSVEYCLLPKEHYEVVRHFIEFYKGFEKYWEMENFYFYNEKIYKSTTIDKHLKFIDNKIYIGVKDLIETRITQIPFKECLAFETYGEVENHIISNYYVKVKNTIYKDYIICKDQYKVYFIRTPNNEHFRFLDCELITKPNYPKSWKEITPKSHRIADYDSIEEFIHSQFKFNFGYYVKDDSTIHSSGQRIKLQDVDRNIFATEKQAKSSLAFAQLSQLHKVMIDEYNLINNCNWKPNWHDYEQAKYTVSRYKNNLILHKSTTGFKYLTFPTQELAEFSLEHHRELWKDYYELD